MQSDPSKPIIVLVGSRSGPKTRQEWAGRENLGILTAPAAWRTPWCRWWACDNDVFSHRDDPGWWCREGETAWLRMLDRIDALETRNPPMFVLLPDVVGDWNRTLQRYHEYLPDVRERGLPFALALQNGAEHDIGLIERINPFYVFVGGSIEWKWRHAETFCRRLLPRGIRVHVGRASGPRRVRECIRIGATSCDGTGWGRFTDKMLPPLFRVLDDADPQTRLDL